MGARVRADGRTLCAAIHDEEPGDVYIGDQELGGLAEAGVLVPSPTHLHAEGCDPAHCAGSVISASGAPVCGDGIWLDTRH